MAVVMAMFTMTQMTTITTTVGDIVGDETGTSPEPVKPSAWFTTKTKRFQ